MLKKLILSLCICCTITAYAQYDILIQHRKSDSLLHVDKVLDAYNILRKIEPVANKKDTSLYPYILWNYTVAVSLLEAESRAKENWKFSLSYATEALGVIKKGKDIFEGNYADREYWMYKNIIVALFGMGYPEKAKEYQDKLYAAYKQKKLPEGIDQFYNFEFFKWKGKNVWGYEWYPTLGDPETQGSFSKIIYYVYSTDSAGNDKDQLYRIHVQKFHKPDEKMNVDYVLNKQLETATKEVSGTLHAYTYKAPIDYTKLRADIRQVLNGVYQPVAPAPPKKNAAKKAPAKRKK